MRRVAESVRRSYNGRLADDLEARPAAIEEHTVTIRKFLESAERRID